MKINSIFIKNALYICTMEEKGILSNSSVFIKNNEIVAIGNNLTKYEKEADKVINAENMIILPGFINTHHHFFQTLTRAVPEVQNAKLFDWLTFLYNIWAKITPEMFFSACQTAMCELILSGCTTSLDHFYLFPYNNNSLFELECQAAREIGMRLHICRGSMSLSKADGGLPPECVVQDEDTILAHTQEVIEKFHETSNHPLIQVVVAPCSPFSVTKSLMEKSMELAEKYNVMCHTHLAETKDEIKYCKEKFKMSPLEYMENLNWLNNRVSFAHSIYLSDEDLNKIANVDAKIAHCPTSNMRLASGIARIREMLDRDIKVGLGVDGSASNDSSNMFMELRQALLLQRIKYGESGLTGLEALKMATVSGADVLGRKDIGKIKEGYTADIIGVDINKIQYAGATDKISALIFCGTYKVDLSIINGKLIIEDGKFVELNLNKIIENQKKASQELLK